VPLNLEFSTIDELVQELQKRSAYGVIIVEMPHPKTKEPSMTHCLWGSDVAVVGALDIVRCGHIAKCSLPGEELDKYYGDKEGNRNDDE